VNIVQSIAAIEALLQQALVQQDWVAIAELDGRCRSLVSEAANGEARANPAVRSQIEGLSQFYGELQQAARAERERIAGELTRLNQTKHVNQAYRALE